MTGSRPLREDALAIWHAGVAAVDPERLLAEAVSVESGPRGTRLVIAPDRGDIVEVPLAADGRVIVVGGGKAGAGMARGLEAALAPRGLPPDRFLGVLSVPADCVGPTERIELVAGRPAGVNEPRPEGADAADRMLRSVAQALAADVVICLLSGGGSALLPAPIEGVSLEQKALVARRLSAAGANINELNSVRQHLSRFKGGGLARASRAGRLVTLVISDVLGDPLDLVASGPTLAPGSTPADALGVLARYGLLADGELAEAVAALRRRASHQVAPTPRTPVVLLANNASAIDAAGVEAERRGYRHAMQGATAAEGPAEEVGRWLAGMARHMRDASDPHGPNCLITGGEPTVTLAPPEVRGRGGRNQQLVAAALAELGGCESLAIVSGGTDGEDGPTDAAGAMIDAEIAMRTTPDGVADALARNDCYTLFGRAGGLLKTGPTHTNVCDLRVVTVGRP